MLGIIRNEKNKPEKEPDSDGWYPVMVKRGDITYTCCGKTWEDIKTGYIAEGDGDTCPFCESPITFTRYF